MKATITAIILILIYSRVCAQEADYKTFFNDGRELYKESKYKESIDKFLQSYKLQRNAKTAYYLAFCYYKKGDCDSSFLYSKFVLDHRKELEASYILQCTKLLSACGYDVSYMPPNTSTYTHVAFTLSTDRPQSDVNSKAINSDAAIKQEVLQGNKVHGAAKITIVKRKVEDKTTW